MPKLREDMYAIYVTVAGVPIDQARWASMEGGDIDAKGVKSRPGGMQPEETYGGPRTRTDATVMRQYSTEVIHQVLVPLERVAGTAGMSIGWTPVDGDGNPNGATITITGKLDSVKQPKKDANNPAVSFISLVMSCDEAATVS